MKLGRLEITAMLHGTKRAKVWTAIREDGLIAGIKTYRELYGCGLKDAKEAVERMIKRAGYKKSDFPSLYDRYRKRYGVTW